MALVAVVSAMLASDTSVRPITVTQVYAADNSPVATGAALKGTLVGTGSGLTNTATAPGEALMGQPATITACVKRLPHKSGVHMRMTLSQATMCAPGAPVYQWDRPQASASAAFIVMRGNSATINFNTPSTKPLTARPPMAMAAVANCPYAWSWRQAGWSTIDTWGSINGWGFGNHCGWASAGTPNANVGCVCLSNNYQYGTFDSNYGWANYHDARAVDWLNADYHDVWLHWSAWARIWWDANGNTAVWAYSQ